MTLLRARQVWVAGLRPCNSPFVLPGRAPPMVVNMRSFKRSGGSLERLKATGSVEDGQTSRRSALRESRRKWDRPDQEVCTEFFLLTHWKHRRDDAETPNLHPVCGEANCPADWRTRCSMTLCPKGKAPGGFELTRGVLEWCTYWLPRHMSRIRV